MRRLALALAAILLSVAACSEKEGAVKSEKMFGTDAQTKPSEPVATLRYADHSRGFAELRLPAGEGPFPLAVIFHGGCWTAGIADQRYMAPLATRWQQQGIATLNVDYREVGDGGGWPGSFVDWNGAASLIGKAVRNYPIDGTRITLVGHSAGALPALWLAEQRQADNPGGAASPTTARAAILLDGPVDVGQEAGAFDTLCDFSAVEPFMGGTPDSAPGRFVAISPATQPPRLEEVLTLNAKLPSAPEGATAPLMQSGTRMIRLAEPEASHFDIITPGNAAYERNEAAMLAILRGE